MKLTYIYHSCFVIETSNFAVIIDYYRDSNNSYIKNLLQQSNYRLYVLSTHSHADHFNKNILKWEENHENITYIFSKEILDNHAIKANEVICLDKLKEYSDINLSIKAYGSTDVGGSFLVDMEGKKIFHAGDLNNWHWNEESTEKEIIEAENYYLKELQLLSKDVKHLHLAMFPLDPRLGKNYAKGAMQFVDTIKTDIFAPMHFGEKFDNHELFASYASNTGCKSIFWKRESESITI